MVVDLWVVISVGWGMFALGLVVAALCRSAAEHYRQPDPETSIRWPDLELEGGTSSPTVPTAPTPLGRPER